MTAENYKLAGSKKNEIIDFETEAHGMTLEKTVRVFQVHVKIQETCAQYSIKHEIKDKGHGEPKCFDRCSSFFEADVIEVTAIAPDTGGQLDHWIFDADVSIDLNDFSLTCNLVYNNSFLFYS